MMAEKNPLNEKKKKKKRQQINGSSSQGSQNLSWKKKMEGRDSRLKIVTMKMKK